MSQVQERARIKPIPVPEPNLTPDELVARAAALVPLLRAQQDESDKRGYYSQEVHEAMKKAGLYRVLQPKLWGGYEFDVPTFLRCSIEIGRGHPGASWCYTLSSSHVLVASAHFSPKVQAEIFSGDGDFRAPHKAPPGGKVERADGGYIVSGVWSYSSGIPYSTHVFGGCTLPPGPDVPPGWAHFIVPREKVTMLSDWGGDHSLGMQASGSNSAKLENVFVPADHFITTDVLLDSDPSGAGTPGTELHGNPMYLGVVGGLFHATFGSIFTGAARAALEEYERIMRKAMVPNNPHSSRLMDPDSQRVIGKSVQLTDSAEALTLACGEMYMEQRRRWKKTGKPITAEDTLRMWGMAQEAVYMACEAIEMMFRSAGASASVPGQKLGRYFRDCQMYLVHPSSQPRVSTMLAMNYLKLPFNLFGERSKPAPESKKD